MNNKGADQTTQMSRLICALVVRIWQKQVFSWCGSNILSCTLHFFWKDTSLASFRCHITDIEWAPSSEFVSSSIPSWQVLTAHAQPFIGARDLAFCLKVPLDSLLVWASSEGSGETARMRRLTWTFAVRIGDKYQIRLMRSVWKHTCNRVSICNFCVINMHNGHATCSLSQDY